jgi:hypothetical protein
MESGSGWVTVYSLTLKGKKVAEKMFKEGYRQPTYAPHAPPVVKATPVLMARKKEKPKNDTELPNDPDDTGKTTFDMKKYLENNPIVNAPDDVNVVNQLQ